MISLEQIQYLLGGGGRVVGPDEDKLGNVGHVYLDAHSGKPEWVSVITGMFGGRESLVPLAEGTLSGDQITVPYEKHKVKDAPQVEDSEEELSEAQVAEMCRYYGIEYYLAPPDSSLSSGNQEPSSGSMAGGAMTGSKEQPEAGTEQIPMSTARLRKFTVTDSVAQSDSVPS